MNLNQTLINSVEVKGNRIRYSSQGSGEPLLYLHDFKGFVNDTDFHEKMAKNYRVISVEMPGFGESERPEWLTSMEDMSFYFLDILDTLELDKVHVVGHSLGGWLAADIASKYTHRIKKLVLINAMGLHLPDVEIPDIFMISPEQVEKLLYFDPAIIDHRDPDFLMKSRADTMTARLAWNPRFHDPKLQYRLHRIEKPVLIVWGESNRFIAPDYAQAYKELIPHAEIEWISKCGHLPQIEQPEKVTEKIDMFLSK